MLKHNPWVCLLLVRGGLRVMAASMDLLQSQKPEGVCLPSDTVRAQPGGSVMEAESPCMASDANNLINFLDSVILKTFVFYKPVCGIW